MSEQKSYYYKVAVKSPLFKLLSYSYPKPLSFGQKVEIPLGKKQVSGVVFEEDEGAEQYKNLRAILKVYEEFSPLSEARLRWVKWLSRYYFYPVGLVMDLNFPPLPYKKKKEKSSPCENQAKLDSVDNIELNADQKTIVTNVLKEQDFKVHLLHGVTGSGKTEVYKSLVEKKIEEGKQVLLLLPEIFLTPQIVGRFLKKFPDKIGVMHSQITPRQKTQVWEEFTSGSKQLLIGTRSALFCPLPHLSLIIIDEEHDSSFKQEDKFRYQARDSAIVLAKELNVPIVLGSATPSLSSWHQSKIGNYQLHQLSKRAFDQDLPSVRIVDLKQKKKLHSLFWLSDELFLKMQETLSEKKQVALFLNRRGVSGSLICLGCGDCLQCPNCDISLTLHGFQHLLCHYCSYMEKKPQKCSKCLGGEWLEKGLGTEAVEEKMKELFPQATVIRADRDAILSRKEMENFMDIVQKEEAQIIIGTQMLSKGLDFPSIQLVGLLLADMGFHFPDFRATENSFQTLLQMSGRSGRKEGGEVILQTFNPDHPSFEFIKEHDYEGFVAEELKMRKSLFYPPFSRLCLFEIDSLKEKEGRQFASDLVKKAKEKKPSQGVVILGPSPAAIFKIKNRYRFQILIKASHHQVLQSFLDDFLPLVKEKSFVRLKVDRDPGSML